MQFAIFGVFADTVIGEPYSSLKLKIERGELGSAKEQVSELLRTYPEDAILQHYQNKIWLAQADRHFQTNSYNQALTFYLKVNKHWANNSHVKSRIQICLSKIGGKPSFIESNEKIKSENSKPIQIPKIEKMNGRENEQLVLDQILAQNNKLFILLWLVITLLVIQIIMTLLAFRFKSNNS
ncbi:hypothetical protein [Leptospira kmetyi]|nr:hypothetical protein [Leptospira kmetyi]